MLILVIPLRRLGNTPARRLNEKAVVIDKDNI